MVAHNDTGGETVLFSAILTPHRSLTRVGFLAVMIAIGGLSFVNGVMFLAMGAWPVVGFLGLDVALVYWAFRANDRAAGAYEKISITAEELRVEKVGASGELVAEWTANPLWVRLDRETHEEFGLQKLFLVSRGRRLGIASFLAPVERESFAEALSRALWEARRGPTRTVTR
jgi:uncharacterized membrane protein